MSTSINVAARRPNIEHISMTYGIDGCELSTTTDELGEQSRRQRRASVESNKDVCSSRSPEMHEQEPMKVSPKIRPFLVNLHRHDLNSLNSTVGVNEITKGSEGEGDGWFGERVK